MKEIIKSTNGKKTQGFGILMVAFQILMIYAPDLINQPTERAITLAISSGAVSGLAHKVWRNREWIKNKVLMNLKFKRLWKRKES